MASMTYKTLILTLTLTALVISVETLCTTFCNNNVNKSAPLHFLHTVDKKLFSTPGTYFDIDCCADGFTNIEWSYHNWTHTSWQPWPWFPPCKYCSNDTAPYRELCDQSQKLQFLYTSTRYAGRYRCNISSSITNEYILREYELVVSDCNYMKGDIQFIEQPNSLHQPAALGHNISFTCAGDFGCPSSDPVRQANWTLIDDSGNTRTLVPGQNKHFDITYNQSFPEITVTAILNIVGVEENDYKLKFQCNIATSTLSKSWDLTLHEPEIVEKMDTVTIIVLGSVLAGVVLIVAILVFVFCCYKPQIDYRWRRFWGRLPARNPEDTYDGCIIHSEENAEFVEDEIKKPLLKENYKIFTQVPDGQSEIAAAHHIDRSSCAILILSKAEIEDRIVNLMFAVALNHCGTNMVVIEKDDIKEKVWKRAVGDDTLKTLHKILKTVKWQGKDKMSKRQRRNFLSEIKLSLPLPGVVKERIKTPIHQRNKSDSSSAPLLRQQTTSVSCNSSIISESSRSKPMGDVSESNRLVSLSTSEVAMMDSDTDLQEEVFKPSEPGQQFVKPQPQKQLSHDSGIANSPTATDC